MASCEPKFSTQDFSPEEKSPQQSLDQFHCFSEEYYSKILTSENIGQLLYYIAMAYNLPLTYQQQKHFDLIFSCTRGEHYIVSDCLNCRTRAFVRTPCNSFFCSECRKYLTGRVKRNAKKYLWDCNHFYATFTLPPEIQRYVSSWHTLKEKKYHITKEGVFKEKKTYYTDLIYKSVDQTIKGYCKKHYLEIGSIILPHSYGSENLNWFFHPNVLLSSKAIYNPKLKYKKLRSCSDFTPNLWSDCYRVDLTGLHKDHIRIISNSFINSIIDNQIIIYEHEFKKLEKIYSDFNNKLIDFQFNYNELRAIYKEKLGKNFKVFIRDTPQVKFAEKYDKQKKRKTIYISYKKSINILLDYFRHIPLGIGNIKKIKGDSIWYQTSKQKEKGIRNKCSLPGFFELIMQHIPPSHFRTIRQYGLYSNHHRKRKKDYPTNQPKPPKQLLCKECKTPMDKNDFIGRVHNGMLIWLNPDKLPFSSIFFHKRNLSLTSKDFEGVPYPEIDPNGRLREPVVPPPDLKPLDKPQFPPKDNDLPYGEVY